ncbi:hypothetical protein LGL08_20635 [Clostridium estertheticum]|uniref:hypothetical protein n=1 Tax=Clostridium estertheticum TaxID=238834 RepID=UPI001CF13075|nr:hypothetical protein [Clostridium estertheticum]MCB2308884.1 hypothetical protein [Clostridium estertheticum]MCB2347296.1 hypothetical protein [Clostridium estertheticum]MCB2351937.1 hypothetical protein [Clostridium estertheticum]WAG48498.1 hypothetical protein LL127_23545 [Clostridium estertheticum]
MEIRINETKELKNLTIIGANGIDWTNDLLGNADATTYNEETEEHEMSQETFDWWNEYINNNIMDELELVALADELEIEEDIIRLRVQEAVGGSNDMGDEHMITQNVFAEIREENK